MSQKHPNRSKLTSTPRERAEEALRIAPPDIAGMSAGEIQKLVHELQVHQIELRIQNEQLLASQAELAQSRDRFNDLYDFAPVGYVTMDQNGTIVEANLTAARMLGVERQKLVCRKFTQFVAPAGQDAHYHHLRAALDCEDRQACDVLLRRQDGTTLFARMETVCFCEAITRTPHCRSALIDISQRKLAEEELAGFNAALEQQVAERTRSLREGESRLRQVLEAGEIGMFEFNPATGESNWNTVEFELLGIQPGDAPADPETLFRFVHPEDAGALRAKWDEAIRTGRFDAEFRIVRADGGERWLAGKGRFLFEGREGGDAPASGQRTARFLGVNYDITARKRAEESLAENRLRLAGIVNAAMDAIISVDAGMRVILFNEAAEKLFRCPAVEAVGSSLDKFIPARFHGTHTADVQRFGEAGATSRMMGNLRSVTGLKRDGEEFPVEASISQVDAGGQKIFTAILRDVTSRMRNEAVLRRQAQLLHLSHDAILVWSTKGGIEYWNRGAMQLYGFDEGESMGRVPRVHLKSRHPTPWPQIESELRRSGAWEGMLRQTAKDGEELVVSERMQIIAEDEAKGMVVLETNRDITDRQRLEESLLQAGEEERQRIGRDLHDGLGQEITAIALLNNSLQNSLKAKALPEAATAERLAELLRLAGRQVRRISHGLQPVPPDPDSLMTGVRTLVVDANLASGAECEFRCDTRVAVHNHESANHLYRIAQEALQNALRHGKPEKVTVSLERSGERVVLEIQDDGAGFEPETTGPQGIGLRTMRYRAEAIGGLLELIRPPTGGVLVRCSAPDPQPMP